MPTDLECCLDIIGVPADTESLNSALNIFIKILLFANSIILV